MRWLATLMVGIALGAAGTALLGPRLFSRGGHAGDASVPAARAADAVAHAILAHRAVYATAVVDRLGKAGAIAAREDFDADPKCLPLPAQFLRLASERMAKNPASAGASFALVSEWAINKVNRPRSAFERAGLAAVTANPDAPYREVQAVAGKRYIHALYADRAVTAGCIACHNAHPDSPRKDFELGEVMGGLVVSVEID